MANDSATTTTTKSESYQPNDSAALPESANLIADKKGPGILLRTLKRGDENYFPQPGDLCSIHYEGRLEPKFANNILTPGAIVASSRRRNATHNNNNNNNSGNQHMALQFALGAGHVLEGLEVAVSHMSLHQRVEATIPALYAYGHVGYPPRIPPRATLLFDIELVNILPATKENKNDAADVDGNG